MIFLDTTFLVDLLRKNDSAMIWLTDSEEQALYTSEINAFEMYTGLYRMSEESKTRLKTRTGELEQLLARTEVLPFDRAASMESARILSALMSRGIPIGARDAMIAGTALARGITRLLTRNVRNFQQIAGLTVESY